MMKNYYSQYKWPLCHLFSSHWCLIRHMWHTYLAMQAIITSSGKPHPTNPHLFTTVLFPVHSAYAIYCDAYKSCHLETNFFVVRRFQVISRIVCLIDALWSTSILRNSAQLNSTYWLSAFFVSLCFHITTFTDSDRRSCFPLVTHVCIWAQLRYRDGIAPITLAAMHMCAINQNTATKSTPDYLACGTALSLFHKLTQRPPLLLFNLLANRRSRSVALLHLPSSHIFFHWQCTESRTGFIRFFIIQRLNKHSFLPSSVPPRHITPSLIAFLSYQTSLGN